VRIGTVRKIELPEQNLRAHYYVRLAEPAEEPWHIAWSDGPQQISGWQSDEDLAAGVDVGYVPVTECGRATAKPDRDIPEEMVEKAARALLRSWDDADEDTQAQARSAAEDALSAALAGRQVVDLPEPDARREQLDGAVDVWNLGVWSVTANADRVAIVTGRDGVGDGLAFYADRARKIAAALIAGAERLDRAAGSGSGEQP
jgi:hypothetical protein